ncbi:sodium:proton antiporter [Nonomuraea sp. NPDC050310]|uniref:cation:proton antiporter n=1 Tax=Nonomuraea sp. NPDC050310 TaxID=3154935 RepID=UPI0033F076C7
MLGQLAVVLGLMLATALLVAVGERVRRPYPVLVLLLGVALALMPGVPDVRIDPELILPIFLPPLIFAAAQRSSWGMILAHRRTVVWMALVLVLVTVAAVAWTTWLVIPGVTAAAAIAFGALTAPPDPVAAEAVAEPLRLPRRLVTTLQSEGLCNDATALVVYGVAVQAMLSGTYSVPVAVLDFCYEAGAAVLLGLGAAWLARWLLARIAEETARNALTLVVPFATYLAADAIGASGVLAVLAAGLTLGRSTDQDAGVKDRLYGGAFWDTLELLITGLAFGLIGLELRAVLEAGVDLKVAAWHAAAICVVIVGVRFAWMAVSGPMARRSGDPDLVPANWREDLVLAYCGMRGLATLALALALPLDTPARGELLLAAFAVIAVTLVLPGLTLPPLVRALGVQADADAELAATRPLAIRAGRAALGRLNELAEGEELPDEVVERLRERHRSMLVQLGDEPGSDDYQQVLRERVRQVKLYRQVEDQMVMAARAEILRARREPGVDPKAADQVLRRLDLQSSARA